MTTVYVDRYGVKHIALYSFNYRTIRNKQKDTNAVKRNFRQETRNYEYSNNYKQKKTANLHC